MNSERGQGSRSRRTVQTSTPPRERLSKPELDRYKNGTGPTKTSSTRRKKPNHSILSAVIIVLLTHVAIIVITTWLYNRWSFHDVLQWFSTTDQVTEPEKVLNTQNVPLQKAFSFDFELAMKLRERNMKRYDYKYSKNSVDRRTDLSLQEFRDVYDGKWPVIIQGVVPKWRAFNWTRQMLCETYGQERVTMKGVNGGLGKATMMALPLELFCQNTNKTFPQQWTYVEDELFIPMRPWLHKDVGDCIYCEEDFFELFPKEVRPWNAMLLWGTKYSRSALHIDPYNWTGTNAVIFGRKYWKLFPPGQDHLLYVVGGKESNFPLNCFKYNSDADSYDLDLDRHGLVNEAKMVEIEQLAGEMLFIPTGWFHQAFNSEETLAISGQMANSNNYRVVLEEIIKIGTVARRILPPRISTLSPDEQVEKVMSLLSDDILERGRQITREIIAQVERRTKQ